jgi:hypothetical protein
LTKNPFQRTIAGNLPFYRTEAEISDQEGNLICIVYEDGEGWHTELCDVGFDQNDSDLAAAVSDAKAALSRYINRRGDDAPQGLTAVALALWLMVKDDGTAMGLPIGRPKK